MEKLHNGIADPSSLKVEELISMLADGLLFLGSANCGMVQKRRDFLKKDLPPNMIGLCRESVPFSGSNLFGENLNSEIKEVSELNKVSQSLRFRGRGVYRGRASIRRGRWMPRRGFRGRMVKRLSSSISRGDGRKTLNRSGPSQN